MRIELKEKLKREEESHSCYIVFLGITYLTQKIFIGMMQVFVFFFLEFLLATFALLHFSFTIF